MTTFSSRWGGGEATTGEGVARLVLGQGEGRTGKKVKSANLRRHADCAGQGGAGRGGAGEEEHFIHFKKQFYLLLTVLTGVAGSADVLTGPTPSISTSLNIYCVINYLLNR